MTRGKVTGGEATNIAKCANSANPDSRFQPAQVRRQVLLSTSLDIHLVCCRSLSSLESCLSLYLGLPINLIFASACTVFLHPAPPSTTFNTSPKCLPAHLHPLVAIASRAIRFISSSVANGNVYSYLYDAMSTSLTVSSSNLLYPKEDRINNRLMFTCRTCHVGEPATSYCVYQNKLSSQVGDTAGVTQDVGNDPTVCLSGFCLLCGDQIACFVCGSAS